MDDWPTLHLCGSDPVVMRGPFSNPNSEKLSREIFERFISYNDEDPRTRY